jgi:hypothetical protein
MNEYQLNRELLQRGYECDKVYCNSLRYYSKFRNHFITIQLAEKYNKNIIKKLVKDTWTIT